MGESGTDVSSVAERARLRVVGGGMVAVDIGVRVAEAGAERLK